MSTRNILIETDQVSKRNKRKHADLDELQQIEDETFASMVKINQVSFKFELDGSIIPILSICPGITTSDGKCLNRLSLINTITHPISFAQGDIINVSLTRANETGVVDLLQTSPYPRINISSQYCPICHTPLIPSDIGIGKCINRDCPAQLTISTILFLSALGVALHYPIKKVLDSILSRGIITRISQIFSLTANEIINPSLTIIEVQTFLFYLHSIRDKIRVSNLLNGIRIPGINNSFITSLEAAMLNLHLQPSDLVKFIKHPDLQQKSGIPDELWQDWNEFFRIPNNQRLLIEICNYIETP